MFCSFNFFYFEAIHDSALSGVASGSVFLDYFGSIQGTNYVVLRIELGLPS